MLDSGVHLPIERLESVSDPDASPEAWIGRLVRGRDRSSDGEVGLIEGIVTGVRRGDDGDVRLELDTGQELRMADLLRSA